MEWGLRRETWALLTSHLYQPDLRHNTQSENEQRNEKAPQLQEEQYTAEPNGTSGNPRAEPTEITQNGQNIYHIPSTEEVMEELHEVTLQYLNCPDPKEAAARRQRVLISDARGDMEEAASAIIAAAIRNAPQQPTRTSATTSNSGFQPDQVLIPQENQEILIEGRPELELQKRKRGRPTKTKIGLSPKIFVGTNLRKRNFSQVQGSPSRSKNSPGSSGKNQHNKKDQNERAGPSNTNANPADTNNLEEETRFSVSSTPGSLTVLSWNYCGLGNPATVQRLKEIHRMNSPDITFLMETKNGTNMITKTLEWMAVENFYVVPPITPGGGGLLLSWKKDIDLTVRSASPNYIDTVIHYKGTTFQATFVYGEPDHSKRLAVWNELTALQPGTGDPWFLTGDFNELIDNSENKGGAERA